MRSRIGAVTTILTTLALAGCGGGDDPVGGTPSRTPSPTPTPTGQADQPWRTLDGPLGRCGPQPADVADAGFTPTTLTDPEVGSIAAVTAGSGSTVAVLLHQTDGNGLCGWLPYAADLVAEPGLRVLAIDLCGYGESECTGDRTGAHQVDAVEVALAEARRDSSRVVVVGASMGGSVALMTAATDGDLAGAVDLSGPVDWDGIEVVDGGRELKVPVLVAMADSEGADQVDAAREIVEQAPEGGRFVGAESGHGYDLLLDADARPLPLARTVGDWIRGRP
ncbi:alpha/beta hydrolase family protein [Nocardioides nitrophenolicus]|uniref:alpha/beta hydrolase family protein n=1 Tax=Nocardioides nitrophenolicus TaxID=60489 RepID=UPI001959F09E|nr:alpha/beta hydrolase [Nocardioides nitrophenolicus]MBM7516165.1 pimeloyl-ACP methyl ester carboxylesterase [Nocardioides nitrophenolicus]